MDTELTSAAARSMLDKTSRARFRWVALERARCVDAEVVIPTIMDSHNAFI